MLSSLFNVLHLFCVVFLTNMSSQYLCSHCGGSLPRRQDDHGTMVFQCQPWLTMVGRVVTMVSDHGPRKALTMVHRQPWSEITIIIFHEKCHQNVIFVHFL